MSQYITNRKHAYKVVRTYKTRDRIKLQGEFCQFDTRASNLQKYGYKFTRHRPAALRGLSL